MTELADLPNVGKVLSRNLTEVGITNAEQLRSLGAREAFRRIRTVIDPDACLHMLYGLEGAIRGISDSQLPGEVKDSLRSFFRSLDHEDDTQLSLDGFFAGHDQSQRLFDEVLAVVEQLCPAEIRVTKSQVAFRRRVGFASVWMPEMYLRNGDVPLVLTVALRRRDESPRWKQVVEPAPGRFTHHLELRDRSDVDEQVRDWLKEAWSIAG